ncbi:hypothetical protein [Sphingobacterium sp. SGR-19]|uniref:hypothetical protein n=1 Tax=Sphingobacterium sp. SGR-19 TaxID=2710886 RepID=UPI0013EB043B|nr:hypothetical protein [Sphingobacterium sp. SGR-19]NGM64257.1 hypothetical protein [Sphingobacterium sp. SGR-19]
MKQINLFILAISILFFAPSCSKDDPIPEEDQEEVGIATLVFTEVKRELHEGHYHYHDIEGAETISVKFEGKDLAPPVNAHLHLKVDKSYRLELKSTDFLGRESQQTFVDRAETHQAFILGDETGSLEYEYADQDANGKTVNVGVTGYLTVRKEADIFVLRYVLRHLNPGVKENIKASDWNNKDFTKFTGANDLDLEVPVHLVHEGDHDH